jgi:outer membrane lipoprotein-sorting protein
MRIAECEIWSVPHSAFIPRVLLVLLQLLNFFNYMPRISECGRFIAIAVFLFGPRICLAQNKYDVLAKVLQPYGALFYSKSVNKAMLAEVTIRQASKVAPLLLNRRIQISFQFPDKLRVETSDQGQRVILCRNGQNVWVYPKNLGEQLGTTTGSTESRQAIPDFRLPIRDQQIVFLPALFQILRYESIKDRTNQPAWNLEFRIDPQLMKNLKESFVVDALVRQNDYQVENIRAKSTAFSGELEVASTNFLPSLPAETWLPEESIAADAVSLSPSGYRGALQKLSSLTLF